MTKMSLKSQNKIDTNRVELEVVVDAETFEKGLAAAFKKQSKKISIPGFRKGKAPRAFVEKYFGKEVFYEDAVNALYPDALDEAVKEAGLEVIQDKIDFDVKEVGPQGFTFTAALTTKPEVTIENYKGIEAVKKSAEVTDEDIDAEIKKVQERNSRMVTVEDRAAQNDDIAVIDFEGFLDGEPFEGGKGENYSLTLGSGQFIPGFEEQIVGHNTGDEFEVNVTFPEDYQAEELKGKATTFKCKLHEIKMKELPEVDDEFVKDVSEFDTLADYKEDLKKKLAESKEKEAADDLENQLIDKLVELVQGEIPEAMYENKIADSIREFGYRLQSQGLNLDTYMKYTGMNVDQMKEGFRPQAERQVKLRLALEKIAALEELKAGEEDLNQEYQKIAEQYKMEADKIKELIPAAELEKDICVEKAINLVRDNANIKDAE
ncbi:trigger factor [[Clostridium] leptum DSM 753]|jgi:trigger factor|uniref:Trigger factor n=3 Tax=[Clostridium] leptum TaxID=1535 RepID=A7VUX7_9FIRM|nr:trigger factor [[Clostridium] leptum DSM 753]